MRCRNCDSEIEHGELFCDEECESNFNTSLKLEMEDY